MGLKYGGKVKDNYLAMRGPCQEGFHIPTKNELSDLLNIMKNRGFGDTANFTKYLKMPNRGCRGYDDGSVRYQGSISLYWTCTSNMYGGNPSSPSSANSLLCGSEVKTMSHNISYGFFIRPFKNEIIIPDSNRTVLYQGTGNSGIFHNNSLGLISISDDGINRKTISDKNLGATTVRNYGDTGTDANCGYFYQWGNNYGFPFSGSVTTGTTQVDITQYGPGNYYSSSTFILASSVGHGWNSTINKNLRGGQARLPFDIKERQYGGKVKDSYSAMRGPCQEGFHVPRKEEWDSVISIGTALSAWSNTTQCETILNLTNHKYLNSTNGTYVSSLNGAIVWTSSYYSSSLNVFSTTASTIKTGSFSGNRNHAFQIRPFKDKPAIPDGSRTTLVDGSSVASGAGIFSNSSLGLISLSSDGITWITMDIKNLGAPDTTTEGYYYQWGNNNGFVANGYTTSSTQIDASTYGPGNYYSSNIFITQNPRWTAANRDLRGGETGIQKVPVKVKKVYYGGKLINYYSEMQGPCPSGFHISTKDEWTDLCNILFSTFGLDQKSVTMKTYLKMPQSGHRSGFDGSKVWMGGNYWSSTPSSSAGHAYYLFFEGSQQTSCYEGMRAYGYSIRPQKDISIVPDNTWTVLYDGSSTATGAGIFHNSILGLISISGDGQTWITIADKNLGATIVYNNGDSLSADNCGGYFQWGNNYMFPYDGTITTSNTQVDASNYGPGNYYSSNTFITSSSSPYDWSNVQNDNLRGRKTGIQRPILIREDNL